MRAIPEHSQRRALTEELHARPFTPLRAPAQALYLAFKPEQDGPDRRSAERDREHLSALIASLGGASEVAPDAAHYLNRFGDVLLRWERHSEFVTYTLTLDRAPDALFEPATLELLPQDWLEAATGRAMASAIVEVMPCENRDEAERRLVDDLSAQFSADSLACAWVTGGQALAAGDFRIDGRGLSRFAVLALPEIGPRRLGRIAQRLLEIETYRAMAMLAFPVAKRAGARLAEIDAALSEVTRAIAAARRPEQERETLERLTELAVGIQAVASETAYRFGAARAYESIVDERIAALREQRVQERQDFATFMARRFKPAMRTCHSTAARIDALAERAESAANLLRTRVDVTLEAQNQDLLTSMDRRAKLQLRLQKTVEGLSVVAISYYAVSLAGYVLAPVASALGAAPKMLQAAIAMPIIAAVWWFVGRIRRRADEE